MRVETTKLSMLSQLERSRAGLAAFVDGLEQAQVGPSPDPELIITRLNDVLVGELDVYSALRWQLSSDQNSVYVDRPNIAAIFRQPITGGGVGVGVDLAITIDIVENGVGADVISAFEARLTQGVGDTFAEAMALSKLGNVKNIGIRHFDGTARLSTATISSNGDQVGSFPVWYQEALAGGVLSPPKAEQLAIFLSEGGPEDGDLTDWWSVDPVSGQTVGTSLSPLGATGMTGVLVLGGSSLLPAVLILAIIILIGWYLWDGDIPCTGPWGCFSVAIQLKVLEAAARIIGDLPFPNRPPPPVLLECNGALVGACSASNRVDNLLSGGPGGGRMLQGLQELENRIAEREGRAATPVIPPSAGRLQNAAGNVNAICQGVLAYCRNPGGWKPDNASNDENSVQRSRTSDGSSNASRQGIRKRIKEARERIGRGAYDPLMDTLSPDEVETFVDTGRLPEDISWHHTVQTSSDPSMADDIGTIQPVRGNDHIFGEHSGDTGMTPTAGIRGDVTTPERPIFDPNDPQTQTERYYPGAGDE